MIKTVQLKLSKIKYSDDSIGHSGERYLHPGRVSAGCISITETTRWMEIYDSLIKARKGDFMSVGVLEVVD